MPKTYLPVTSDQPTECFLLFPVVLKGPMEHFLLEGISCDVWWES